MRRFDARTGAPLAVVVGGLVAGLIGALAGRPGTVPAAALATVAVLFFFWTGAIPVLLVGGDLSRAGIGFLLLGFTYLLRLVGLLAILSVSARSSAVDVRWLAYTVIALALVWVLAQVALLGRSRRTLDV